MMIIRPAAAALLAAASIAMPIVARERAPSRAPAPARRSFSEPAYSADRREIAFVSGGDIW
ncbi:MAG: hypothetical protein ABIQ10_07700, partial [Gemmatimonadaceae bacterium]